MAEYIDKESVKSALGDACEECIDGCEEFDGIYPDCNQCLLHGVIEKIIAIPAADVAPVRHGHWIPVDEQEDAFDCSECDAMVSKRVNYCPKCGADMRGAK